MCANGNIEHRAFWGALMDFGTDSATGFLEDRAYMMQVFHPLRVDDGPLEGDAPKAAAAWDQAFEDDPVIAYIRAVRVREIYTKNSEVLEKDILLHRMSKKAVAGSYDDKVP